MTALVHLVKADATTRTTTSTTGAELTDYTITWANLTGAGFAAGDEVAIVVGVKTWNGVTSNGTYFAVGFGTSFAGRTEIADSVQRAEPAGNNAGDQYGPWPHKRTLVVNENVYFRGMVTSGTGSYKEFVCAIYKLTGLAASDWAYAETSPGGTATSTYADGASVVTAASGDWLWFASTRWLVANTVDDMLVAITDGVTQSGGDLVSYQTEAENVDDERVVSTMLYSAALPSGSTVRARYRVTATALHEIVTTKIFGLRLNIFQDHAGVSTFGSTLTHSVVDTYQEFAGFPAYSKGTTGPFMVWGWPRHSITEVTKRPYGRIQIDGADWPATDANRQPVADNATTGTSGIYPLLFGYNASQAVGTLDIDLDCAEDVDIAPTYACTDRVAVAFSLELAATGEAKSASDTLAGVLAETVGLAAALVTSDGMAPKLAEAGALTAGLVGADAAAVKLTINLALIDLLALYPDAVLASSNLQDSASTSPPALLSDLDDDPTSPDPQWWSAIDPSLGVDVRLGVPAPPGPLSGTQRVRVLLRRAS